MPEGLTHLLAGYIGAERWMNIHRLGIFLVGCILPDILLRGGSLLFLQHDRPEFLELYLVPLHTPVGSVFVCLVLAQFFQSSMWKTAFILLFGGTLAHFLLDLFQRTISGYGFHVESYDSYHWLYPLSNADFQVGLFWPGQSSLALAVLVPWAGWLYLRRRKGMHPPHR